MTHVYGFRLAPTGSPSSIVRRSLTLQYVSYVDSAGGSGVFRLECGVRLLDGELSPLSGRWTHGAAVVDSGVLVLTPYVGGVRLLRRRPVRIAVERVEPAPFGTVGMREVWSARPGLTVIRLRSASASLEVCLKPRHVQQVVERLAS